MTAVAPIGALPFPILERIPLVGDLAVSPHGLGIAAGFLVGAGLMLRRAELRGLGHVHVPDIHGTVQALLVRAAIGAILGARLFYALTHLGAYAGDPLAVLRVWEGGLSFLGGLAGAILVALPAALGRNLRLRQILDSAAPGVAGGLIIGRFGDLVIGDHIGRPTDLPLGWRCTGNYWVQQTNSLGFVPPRPYPSAAVPAPSAGCYDTVVHQTALYDFLAAAVVLGLLLWFERRPRWDGFFVAVFVYAYGGLRFVSEFARADTWVLGLTGSQWAVLGAVVAMTTYLARRRPWREPVWAWDLRFDHPWLRPPGGDAPTTGGTGTDTGETGG